MAVRVTFWAKFAREGRYAPQWGLQLAALSDDLQTYWMERHVDRAAQGDGVVFSFVMDDPCDRAELMSLPFVSPHVERIERETVEWKRMDRVFFDAVADCM
jgi:hypothetical protein